MRGHKVRFNENGDGEVDQNFWAQAAANEGGGDANDGTRGWIASLYLTLTFPLGSQPIPFNTQFFADDDDDGHGFNDDFDGPGIGSFPGIDGVDGDGEHDLLAATQGTSRRVKPEFVKYAKRAKRVDVRKLKDNIWKGLNIVVSTKGEDEDEQMVRDIRLLISAFLCEFLCRRMLKIRRRSPQTPMMPVNSAKS